MNRNRKFYLEDIPLDEAWRRFIEAMESSGAWAAFPGEDIPLDEALGRVTAVPVWAALSSPGYHASAMDGYAVCSVDTLGATETAPKRLRIGPNGQAGYVDTGDPVPTWADAVIQIEHTQFIDEGAGGEFIEIQASVAPWTAVRPMGEDMVATELVLPANHLLKPVGPGRPFRLRARNRQRPPQAARSGDPDRHGARDGERAAQEGLKSGDIIEYNSLVLASQVRQWGGMPTRYPIVVDDYQRIKETIREAAATHDLVLVNAGSSAGE